MVDFVCDYYNNVEGMPVRSSVEVSSQLLCYTARLRQLPARLIRACATEEHALLAVQLAYCWMPPLHSDLLQPPHVAALVLLF